MICRLRTARRASGIVHHIQPYRRPYSSTLDELQQTSVDAPPFCQRSGVKEHRAQHQIAFAALLCDGQKENRLQWPGKDARAPLHSSANLSVSKSSRQQKTPRRKQKAEREGSIDECAQTHPASVAEVDINVKLSASLNGSTKILHFEEAPCSSGDANTFEMEACKQSAAKGQSIGDSECETCTQVSKEHSLVVGHGSNVSSPLLEDPLKAELVKKVKLIERYAPGQAANFLNKWTFKRCSLEQLETVLQFLEDYFLSRETAFKVVMSSPGALLYPVDLLQQKLQVFGVFQIEKKVVSRLCSCRSSLTLSVESLQQKFTFLEEGLGLNVEARNKIFLKDPFSFAFSVENLSRNRDLLRDMGATEERMLRLIEIYPHILKMSCDKTLMPRYRFFQQIGISAARLPRCVCFASRVSLDTLKLRMQSIKGLGFSDVEVCSMVNITPELLKRKTETLKTKVDYLVNEQKRDFAEIAKWPGCLLRSLHGWIIPRCRCAERAGLSEVLPLSAILCFSNVKFERRLKKGKLQRT